MTHTTHQTVNSSVGLTLVMPCFNEEKNIEATVETALSALHDTRIQYEILIFNDASTDRTGEIIDGLQAKHKNINAIHYRQNKGIGYIYHDGVRLGSKEYIALIGGDNELRKDSLRSVFLSIGKAELILTYIENMGVRPVHRQILSKTFVWLINLLCGYHIRYFNGPNVLRREDVLRLNVRNESFAFMADIVSRLLAQGFTYFEIPFTVQMRPNGRSNALKLRSFIGVSKTLLRIILFQFKRRFLSHSQETSGVQVT